MNLRQIYPERNILTFKETPTVSGQEGLDLQKKTDGSVNILGEVATAPVANWLIQMAQVASLFTMFTHHAKTTHSLVVSMRNSLLQAGGFSNEKVAEEQVAEAINFDIHMNKDASGHRYIERITEILPVSEEPYPNNMDESMKTFFERSTDRRTFRTVEIVAFDGTQYIYKNSLSKKTKKQIYQYLNEEEAEEFSQFIDYYESGDAHG